MWGSAAATADMGRGVIGPGSDSCVIDCLWQPIDCLMDRTANSVLTEMAVFKKPFVGVGLRRILYKSTVFRWTPQPSAFLLRRQPSVPQDLLRRRSTRRSGSVINSVEVRSWACRAAL